MSTDTFKPVDLSAQRAVLLARMLEAENAKSEQKSGIPKRKNPAVYPLSPGQQRMWLLDQFEQGTHYNEDFDLRLAGSLDISVLKRSLAEIFRRHEAMRSTFTLVEGNVVQRLVPVQAFELPVMDLRAIPESTREIEAMRLAVEEARKPLDLSKGPLWRFSLLSLAEDDHLLLITVHHVAVDGWSRHIFGKELFALYNAFLTGEPSPLPEPVIQYSDYGAWQTEWLKSDAANQQRAYWAQSLSGAPQLLELPADHSRPPVQTFHGSRYSLSLPKELTTSLKALSSNAGVTLFMTLLASFDALIKRYTEKDDIVVGTPVANRTHPEIEGLIGFFVNTIALRSDLSGDPSFRELLQRVRRTTIGGVANQDLPFEQLVELLHPERTESYTPLVQVLLVLRYPLGSTNELAELSVSNFEIDNGTSKFDLTLYITDDPDGLYCTFEYNTDLFNADRIERMAEHFRILMEGAVRDPNQRLSELPILTPAERNNLLAEWNNTAADYPKDVPLAQLIEAQVKRTPDAPAVARGDQQLTYRELNARANRLAHELRRHGAGPGQLVGLYVGRSTDLVVALLAIVKSGAAYLPLDPLFPADRLSYMLEDCGARLLVTEQGLRGTLPAFGGTAILVEDASWQANSDDNPSVDVGPEDLAYLIYTSGSTGKPKGVQVPRGALTNFLWSMREWLQLNERDRLLAVTTISFDIAGLEIWLPLLVGAQTVVASREAATDGNALQELLKRHDITFLQATPVTWRLLFDAGWRGKANLTAVCGGEAMPPEVASHLVPAVKLVWNLYGPTETTIWSTGYKVTDPRKPILIGRPIANTQCYILDGKGQPVPVGVTGELYIGGDGLARGYLNRPELTTEKFVADPFRGGAFKMYRTGDLARYCTDGNIECLGRVDHQVKLRGYRIELGEIEAHLKDVPGIKQAVVIVREDTPGDKRLVGYYATNTGESEPDPIRAEDLRARLSANLPDYMVPAAFVPLESFPLTPNGKLDRKALPAPEAGAFATRNYEPPQGEIEIKLAAIWADVLNLERVGRHDSFFDLGGHSLMVVQVVTRARQALSRAIEMRDLFAHPELADLAHTIGNAAHAVLQPIARIERKRPPARVESPVETATGSYG